MWRTAIDDCGGTPGVLDVPMPLSTQLAENLVGDGFDIATSYAMVVDHGFSNVLGGLPARQTGRPPVIPVHVNSLSDPRPTLKRCRELGEAIGRWGGDDGKRVAFLGSGGLSAPDQFHLPAIPQRPQRAGSRLHRHGGGEISPEKWHGDITDGMGKLSADLVSGEFKAPWINKSWDEQFLQVLASGDLTGFDSWTDADILEAAGYGGGEIRMWIVAIAAGQGGRGGAGQGRLLLGRDHLRRRCGCRAFGPTGRLMSRPSRHSAARLGRVVQRHLRPVWLGGRSARPKPPCHDIRPARARRAPASHDPAGLFGPGRIGSGDAWRCGSCL